MTPTQKFVAEKLIEGYYLVRSGPWYRLRTSDHIVVRKISDKTFQQFKNLLRSKNQFFYLNKNLVRQLHGKTYLKQQYKSSMLERSN